MLIYEIKFLHMGLGVRLEDGVCIWHGVLVNGIGC